MSTNSKQMFEALDRSGIITLRFDKSKNGHDIMVTELPELESDDVWLLGYIKEGTGRPEGNMITNSWGAYGMFKGSIGATATGWYEGRIVETEHV